MSGYQASCPSCGADDRVRPRRFAPARLRALRDGGGPPRARTWRELRQGRRPDPHAVGAGPRHGRRLRGRAAVPARRPPPARLGTGHLGRVDARLRGRVVGLALGSAGTLPLHGPGAAAARARLRRHRGRRDRRPRAGGDVRGGGGAVRALRGRAGRAAVRRRARPRAALRRPVRAGRSVRHARLRDGHDGGSPSTSAARSRSTSSAFGRARTRSAARRSAARASSARSAPARSRSAHRTRPSAWPARGAGRSSTRRATSRSWSRPRKPPFQPAHPARHEGPAAAASTWTVIGVMERSVTVEDVRYPVDGVPPVRAAPGLPLAGGGQAALVVRRAPQSGRRGWPNAATYGGERLRAFPVRARRSVDHVLGEFYWTVASGEAAETRRLRQAAAHALEGDDAR